MILRLNCRPTLSSPRLFVCIASVGNMADSKRTRRDNGTLEPYMPTPIAIVSAGIKTGCYKSIFSEMFAGPEKMIPGWRFVDLRGQLIKDPIDGGIGHKEDGRWETTQRCVIGQKSFAKVIINQLKASTELIGVPHGILLLCNQGVHRTNTSGHCLEEAFNEPCWPNGQPVFNCKHFPSSVYYGIDGGLKMIKDARNWLYQPVVDNCSAGFIKPLHERFGFKACSRGTEISNLKTIQHFLEGAFLDNIGAVAEKIWKGAEMEELPKTHGSKPSIVRFKSKPPWHANQRSWNNKRSSYWDDEDTNNAGKRRKSAYTLDDDMPEWVSFEFEPRRWFNLLMERGVDHEARKQLFMLAQLNEKGRLEAWSLISKLLNDWHNDKIWHPSKFVQKGCSNAMSRIYPQIHFA